MGKKQTEVVSYMRRVRRHYKRLGIAKKDAAFFHYLGLGPEMRNNFYVYGIRKIYHRIAELLDQIEELSNDK